LLITALHHYSDNGAGLFSTVDSALFGQKYEEQNKFNQQNTSG